MAAPKQTVTSLRADLATFENALGELELEIVGERAKAAAAIKEAAQLKAELEALHGITDMAAEVTSLRRTAAAWEKDFNDLDRQASADLKELRDTVEGLEDDLKNEKDAHEETRGQLESAESELKAAEETIGELESNPDAAHALQDWLVSNGYPCNPLKVDDALVQAMVDAIL